MTKPQFIEISWTSGSLDEARKISRSLVEKRLVACAQITPWIESIYIWDNQLETTQESRVSLKTKLEFYDIVAREIQENCVYEVPEITYRIIDGGNAAYMEWYQEQLQS
jgi:periplasmic divalent cation tolerance protein